ncbi:MAG: hypothetical protein AAB919_03765 [Patescibacteria group bacterium]
MSYLFNPPGLMRVFQIEDPESTALCQTDRVISAGELVELSGSILMSYDHSPKLALKLVDGAGYLLVEEIGDEDIAELAYQWSGLYVESAYAPNDHARLVATGVLETLQKKFAPLMQQYVRPGLEEVDDAPPLAPVGDEGRGIRFIILL